MPEPYVHPLYQKKTAPEAASVVPSTGRSLPCLHLGKRVDSTCVGCWRRQPHACTRYNVSVQPSLECQACLVYTPDTPDSPDT